MASSFLHDMADQGVRFFLEGGRLRSVGTELLSPDDRNEVRRRKAEIIADLLPAAQTSSPTASPETVAGAPLSYQQERLWMLHEIAERSEEYNSVTVLAVRGRFDPERFGLGLRRVVAANDALRTVFRTDGDTVRQVTLDDGPFLSEVRRGTAEEAYATARALEQAEADHAFDLDREIPVRCWLVSAPDQHYIVLNIHHIACDGWSIGLIMDQLARAYADPHAPLPATTSSYRDYAHRQRATLTGDVLDTLVGHWCERLAGAPLRHALPTDLRPDRSVRRPGGTVRHRVAGPAYTAFRDACLAAGAGEFAGLHAVLGILLARISGQEETIVGSPIANREQRDTHDTVGFFVNMVSVRGAVHAGATFRDVLAVKNNEIDFAYAFQQVPFEKVVERLADRRDHHSTPVFQIALVLQNARAELPRFGSTEVSQLPEVHHHNRFDLEIFVHGSGDDDRELEWVYDAGLFEAATVRRWADWFTTILESVTALPDRPVAELPLPVRAITAAPEPAVAIDVLERIRAVTADDPHRVAVSDGSARETYAGLVAHGRRIGSALRARYGDRAVYALDMDRSIDLVRTITGILSIGATYVVLDPDDTGQRRAAVLDSSDPRCVLVAGRPADPGERHGREVLDVRTLADAGDLDDPPAGGDLYHVFTSGSTGRPKGVRITYANLAAYLGGVVARLRLPEGAAYCWHSSVATDFGNSILFGALATGGRLEIAVREDILDGAAMSAFLRDRAIDVLKITPSHLEALLETRPVADLLPRRTLILGGEAASETVVRALTSAPLPVDLFNHYGPSETTVGVLVAELRDHDGLRPFPVGRPLPGVGVTIRGDDDKPVPFGVAGELVVHGPQVSPGYLGQPADGPFTTVDGRRAYRTGDRVRQRNDGQLVFLGRRDDQFKIRGHRVEPGEIKAALEQVPGVIRGEVLVTDADGTPASVVAFVQPDPAGPAAGPVSEADAAATVEHWREFYDYAYSERVSSDIEFNTSGWISSYTGSRIPEEEMREWLGSALDRISALRPRNVLEIGCGLGIIAYPLSRSVESYLACDFSAEIIAGNEVNASRIDTGRLSFFVCEARDIDQHADRIRQAGVDTVIINSVVQYFPDSGYLDAVLDHVLAIDTVRHVFVGDIRNLDLLDEFSLSLVDARLDSALPAVERVRRARDESARTTELLVSDLYWREFASSRPSVAGVSVLPRVSGFHNELLDFRYDVVLTKDPAVLPSAGPRAAHLSEPDSATLAAHCADLAAGEIEAIVVHGVANPQTAQHCETLRAARSGVAGAMSAARNSTADPTFACIRDLAAAHGLPVSAHYARDRHGQLSRLDVALLPPGGPAFADSRYLADMPADRRAPLVNVPTAALARAPLTDQVAAELARTLPRHMRPDVIVEVVAFPLNRTGKIDRGALRSLVPAAASAGAPGDLVGVTEKRLAGILAELLRPGTVIDRDSDFFEIGGHSLLATRYVHAVNQAFGTSLRVKAVFDRPRLRDFAELLAGQVTAEPADRLVGATPGGDAVPLTPLQHRFWMMAQASGPSTVYNSLMLLEFVGPLSAEALGDAFAAVAGRHRILRAYVDATGRTPVLRTRDSADFVPAALRIPGLDRAGAERLLLDRLNRPFDLAKGPLLDAAVLTAAPDRHFLAMAIHHAIFDGGSEDVFVDDLRECYLAAREGREPRWRDDGDGFRAHAVAGGPPDESSLEFWADQLAGAPPMHSLPLDHDRPDRGVEAGASVHTVFGADTTALVAELSRRHRTTKFVVLNSLTALFISFLSGADDVVIGSPVDCRETETDANAIGMYVNTVAFRHRLDWDGSADQLIDGARAFHHRAVAHLSVPFDRIVQRLNPPRVPGVNPIFQIMLAVQPDGDETFRFGDCEVRSHKVATVQSKFDLTLNAKEIGGRLHIHWEYSRALFTAERIHRTAALFETFVGEVARRPERALSAHRIALHGQPMAVLHGPAVPLTDESYLDAFARTVTADPGRVAVRLPDGRVWDRAALDTRSRGLAGLLHRRGVRAGDLVAIILDRSAESLVAALAINRLGAAYVPMDSAYLRPGAPALTAAQGIRFAVVEDRDSGRDFGSATVVTRREFPVDDRDAVPLPAVRGSDLVYVIFTSGSTGRPKGVAVRHRSVVNYLAHCVTTYLDAEPTAAVLASPLSFDATVTTTLFPLAAGLPVHVVAEGDELAGLARELAPGADGRRLFKLTPSHLVALANLGVTEHVQADRHTFVVGGEDLRAAVAAGWHRAFPQAALFNEYGPTEATVGCMVHRVTADDLIGGSVPIGRPIVNTVVAVLQRGHPCVAGQRGELIVLGEGLARGYLDAEQTRAAFRPVEALGGQIGYHTGDIASLTGPEVGDTGLRYHGRHSREIKVRGFRVSLPEIESVIGGLDEVGDCACAITDDGRGLHAYVVLRGESRGRATETVLRERIAERLPSYMVPDTVRVLAALPLTPNGKVDLARLEREHAPSVPVVPATQIGGTLPRLRTIWNEVLNTSAELPDDVSFFTLGGNSLSVTHLLRRMHEEFDSGVTLEMLYREPTLTRQSALVASARGVPEAGTPLPLTAVEVELTPAQRRIVLLEKLGADYVTSIGFRIAPGAQADHLGTALTLLVDRHPVLASRVVTDGERLLLRPPDGGADPGLVADVLRCRDDAEVTERMAAARDEAVDLLGRALFRAFRYALPDGSLSLQLLIHHVIFDGWSERILLDDLTALYRSAAAGGPGPTAPAVPFSAYAAAPEGPRTAENTAWWIEALTGAPAAHRLPTLDHTHEAERATRRHRVLDGATVADVDAVSRRLGVTPFTVVHSALALAICAMSHEDDVVIGVPTANRTDPRWHTTVGLFMETLPLRTRIGPGATFDRVVLDNQATVVAALARTDFRIETVLNACAPHRDGRRNALYQIMLSYNDEGGEVLTFGGARAERFHLPPRAPKLDLIVDAKMIDGELHLYWEYDGGRFSDRMIHALVTHFEDWLRWGAAHGARPLAEFAGPATSAGSAFELPPVRSVYERFATAWSGKEHEIAVTGDDFALTAGQLHARVVAMAARLAERGLGRKSVVACLSPHVLDYVVSFLACSRMGAVHVPLDASNPGERVTAILDQCDADLVITENTAATPGFPVLPVDEPLDDVPVTPAPPSRPAAISHVMYTSGSTGRPKGVRLSNAATDAYVTGINHAYGIAGAPIAQCGNPAYDVFIEELALSVLVGNRMVVLSPEQRADPAAFARVVERERIQLLPLPTSYWAFLVGAMSDEDFARLRGVDVCAVGGEDYPPAAAAAWFARFPDGPRLYNVYGPTENGPVSMVTELRPDTPRSTLGGPLGAVRCQVRSRFGSVVPSEGRGELYLSGPQLFSGYVDAAPVPEYPTADVVVLDAEHGYRFVERTGSMMKIAGFRVEPGEYDAALRGVPGVLDVRVAPNDERTGVLIYARLDDAVDPEEVGAEVRRRVHAVLPSYMRRYELRFCREIPLTPNGKVDFRALRASSWAAPVPAARRDAPVDGPHAAVRESWQRVLGQDQLDDDRGFFDQGGTSMDILRLLAQLDERFPGAFALIDLYEKPTVELQAEHLRARSPGNAAGAAEGRSAPTARERLAQKRLSRRRARD